MNPTKKTIVILIVILSILIGCNKDCRECLRTVKSPYTDSENDSLVIARLHEVNKKSNNVDDWHLTFKIDVALSGFYDNEQRITVFNTPTSKNSKLTAFFLDSESASNLNRLYILEFNSGIRKHAVENYGIINNIIFREWYELEQIYDVLRATNGGPTNGVGKRGQALDPRKPQP